MDNDNIIEITCQKLVTYDRGAVLRERVSSLLGWDSGMIYLVFYPFVGVSLCNTLLFDWVFTGYKRK